jgi:acetyl esterase/lipase
MKHFFTLVFLFFSLCCLGQQFSEKFTNVNYVGDGQVYHNMDIYLPQQVKAKYPVVVYIYGSAWYSNSGKGADMTTVGAALLNAGFAVVTPNHRSSSDAKYPAQIHDIKAVVRFLRGNADKYKLDDSFIGISGSSSGGHLASLMGTTGGVRNYTVGSTTLDLEGTLGAYTTFSSSVDAVCDFFGPIDFMKMDNCNNYKSGSSPEADIIGGSLPQNLDKLKLLGPITYIDSNDPPFLIFHGGADNVVPKCQSEFLNNALKDAGVQSEYVYMPSGQHGPGVNDVNANLTKMVNFFLDVKDAAVPVSEPPVVNITAPLNASKYTNIDKITISATASDPDGHVVKVEFYDGSVLLGAKDQEPFSIVWSGGSAGTHSITAVATDNSGIKTTSAIVSIVIEAIQSPYNGVAHTIPGRIQAEDYDLGGEGLAFHEANTAGNEGKAKYRNDEVDIEETQDIDGAYNIAYIMQGEWLEYTVNVTTGGIYDLDLRMAADGNNKTLHIEMDGIDITGAINVPNTGGWQTWQTVTVTGINLTAGEHIMRIAFDASYMNLNYVEFRDVITSVSKADISTIEIFPNPFTNEGIQITNASEFTYQITDISGLVFESGNGYKNMSIGRNLKPGMYLLTIRNDVEAVYYKIIKQ